MPEHNPTPSSPPAPGVSPHPAANDSFGPHRGTAGVAPAAKAKGKPAPAEPKDSFREIIETVVFVVVLVLLLKSFAAEAFVIPTGSMATTLWGYQKVVVCPQCGYEFPVNCSDEVERKPPSYIAGGTCPNCRYPIAFAQEGLKPTCNSGDRVLVAKYFYDTGLLSPELLDVVVFKYPEHPQKNHVAMNYIKRLTGRPDETAGIYYGKLYRLTRDKYPPNYPPPPLTDRPEDLWQLRNTFPGELMALLKEQNTPFEMVRKTPDKILAMMRIVFDNDHQPKDLPGVHRWAGADGTGWATDQPFGFRNAGAQKDQFDWLRYHHVLRYGPEPELITDFMGYNSKAYRAAGFGNDPAGVEHTALARNWVGDLILECEVTVDEPDGELTLELSKGIDRFQARWQLASGTCSLFRLTPGGEAKLDSKPTTLKKKGKYRLRFANVDNRLTVWVDGSLAFGDGVVYEPALDRHPTANDLEPASIGVQGARLSVHKLKLWRDTYYTVGVSPSADAPGIREILNNGQSEAEKEKQFHELLSQPGQWERAFRDMPANTLYVQPDHYLCMGDNSPESSDGRTWGLVPKRLMLGRALLVYYPFSLGIPPFNPPVNRFGPIR